MKEIYEVSMNGSNIFNNKKRLLYKGLWLLIVGGVVGYFVEVIFSFFKLGYFESRQGLFYAPFNQIYGIAAVLLVSVTSLLRKKNYLWIFGMCALLGGLFECFCSWIQEYFLGISSWDYSQHVFSFLGRTSFLYMIFWGVLGVLFIRNIYPYISKFIDTIINHNGRLITWIIIGFLFFSTLITFFAVTRWTERQKGMEADYYYKTLLDKYYPDEVIVDVFPKMKIY